MKSNLDAIAQQFTGLLMLNAPARSDLESLPDHDDAEYHVALAEFINTHLSPSPGIDAGDAESICVIVAEQMKPYREHLKKCSPGVPPEECLDGFHGQQHF
jgi:hypothetical protein